MSTRANIIVQDGFGEKLYFYKHNDGYPEGTMPILKQFCNFVKENKIRDNATQSAGWLILLGAEEYSQSLNLLRTGKLDSSSWKVGSIEPACSISGDIEYLYVIDLAKRELKAFEACYQNLDANEELTLQAQPIEVYKF